MPAFPKETPQLDDLNTSLCILESHLFELIDCVRQNDIKLHRFQRLETNLLALNSLRELVEHTLHDTRSVFELNQVTLLLVDEKQELRKCLSEDGMQVEKQHGLILHTDVGALEKVFGKGGHAYLGPHQSEKSAIFFGQILADGGSMALLPLYRRGRLLGSLNFASNDPVRFCEHMATDFLDRLSSVLSVCLENTLNFELLRRTSLIDTLTGVNNRRFFDQRLGEEVDRVIRSGECLSCLFLDIDHFKSINDTFGHQTGDRVLAEVAGHVRSLLRNNDVLARYGGEEFVVLLGVTSEQRALEVAERIRSRIAHLELSGKEGEAIPVRLSVGVATLNPSLVDMSEGLIGTRLVEMADSALYQAKKSGRNRVVNAGVLFSGETKSRMTAC
ncbi:GGDEF domain-containing protein [Methyloterricola oryzae]|uniref:GGDEF domain-containing protein n=1 Tax=Methyloterricola oryzae TaxID=1495050 RepID=UPI001F1B0037|nr:sensor domain-containing diguanylate cyclase [Methyloterricola oryzae]